MGTMAVKGIYPLLRLLKLEQIYEAMDIFYDHMSEVEEQIFFQTANLLNLEADLVFYDTTRRNSKDIKAGKPRPGGP
jgi:hypothetical protein